MLDIGERHTIRRLLKKVNRLAPEMRQMSDSELQQQTALLREQIKAGKILEQVLPRAYATVREADYRVLGLYPYDVQVMGAIVMNQGYIAEMKTGEGKTLTATMPLYLNGLMHKGAFLVTPNEYLAERDETQLAPVYEFLGLTVSTAFRKSTDKRKASVTPKEKRQWYGADIVYMTSSGFAFDYLFSNLAGNKEGQFFPKPFNYALVDEVDMVLLDSATSPFVVASAPRVLSTMYKLADDFVVSLVPKLDYVVKRRDKAVWLTYHGVRKAESYFRIDDLFDLKYRELYRHICLALRAHFFMKRDHDYVVRDGKVILLDETNGRLMKGIQVSSGIQQATEQKEGVDVTPLRQTAASVTFPSLFGMFNKIAGMSGTAKVDENEFINTYNMKVVTIPTNKPVIRQDLPAKIYLTTSDKLLDALKQVVHLHQIGRPVLLVAGSVENSEIISELLLNKGIPHNVLNAFNASREAAMVKDAGQEGAVTVATNMAGRGTDIKISEAVRQKGGLAVIGTEMLAERVRLQLAGRAGRQGDPGTSQFYVSLEDDFVTKAMTSRFQKYYRHKVALKRAGREISQLHGPRIRFSLWMLKNRVASAEENQRTQTNKYETTLRLQRATFYDERNRVISQDNLQQTVDSWVDQGIDFFLAQRDTWDPVTIKRLVNHHFTYEAVDLPDNLTSKERVRTYLKGLCQQIISQKAKMLINEKQLNAFYRKCLLTALDTSWTDQVDYLNTLRSYVGSWALAGRDSGYVYNERAYNAYQKLLKKVKMRAIDNLMLSIINLNKKNQLVVQFM
ncbi:accessory Sec system translocase SecA2 [uncultured Limosilactobacillus sp.]|uniref:accessory Sec system translocase SecA2 n=1 Tax=uncultured Limosilactobacillus sp. TaxID=2837629 RepID=UPI0025D85318|nr:accessory Sec system translocase SecA2 [uncultured Limosilactobacillus sp.]